MRHPSVLTANLTGLLLGMAMYLGISLITQVVQLPRGMHQTVFAAGLTLLPLSASSSISSRLVPIVRGRAGNRPLLPAGASVIAVAMFFFAATGNNIAEACVTMGLVGLGVGFTFAAMPALIVDSVPKGETSSAMSFYQVSRYVGFSIGSGLAITLLRAFDGGAAIPPADAYSKTFLVGAILCLLAAAAAWVLAGLDQPLHEAEPSTERMIEEGEVAAAGLPLLEAD